MSCVSSKKAANILERRGELAGICADKYPPKTEYKQGQTIVKSDTAYLPGDSIPCPPSIIGKDTVMVKVKCPDHRIIYDTITRTDTIQVENTTRVADLYGKLGIANKEIYDQDREIKRLTKQRNILSFSLFGLLVLLGVGIFLRIRKIF